MTSNRRRPFFVAMAMAALGVILLTNARSVSALPATSFAAIAKGTALDGSLSLGGQGISLTGALSEVTATSGPGVTAVGQGILLPGGIGDASRAEATFPGDPGPNNASGSSALPLPLPEIFGNASASANLANGEVSGVATADVLDIDVALASGVLSDTLGAIAEELEGAGVPVIPDLLTEVQALLQTVSAALGQDSLVSIQIGSTTSSVSSEGGKVSADCVANAGQIDILIDPVTNEPLASITIQGSRTHAEANGTTGGATGFFEPAALIVNIAGTSIPIPLEGGTLDLNALGVPAALIQVTVVAADGTAGPNAENPLQFDAQADAVGLTVVVANQLTLSLSLASCTSQAAVAAAQVVNTTTSTSTTTTLPGTTSTSTTTTTLPGTLPVTGGGVSPGMAAAGVMLLIAAGGLVTYVVLSRPARRASSG